MALRRRDAQAYSRIGAIKQRAGWPRICPSARELIRRISRRQTSTNDLCRLNTGDWYVHQSLTLFIAFIRALCSIAINIRRLAPPSACSSVNVVSAPAEVAGAVHSLSRVSTSSIANIAYEGGKGVYRRHSLERLHSAPLQPLA